MSSIGAGILAFLVAVVLLAPRRWALLGMMAGVLFLTKGEAVDLVGVNFFPFRFLELAGFLRVTCRREFSLTNWQLMDSRILLAYGFVTVAFLSRTILGGGTSAGISQVSTADKIGYFLDVTLTYFAFRGLVLSNGDVERFLRDLIFLMVPFVIFLSIERQTGANPLAAIGGIPYVWAEPGGRVRCWGSFMHPSLLGTLGASFLPMYIGLTIGRTQRWCGLAGIILSAAIVFYSGSGGPATFALVSIVGWLLWGIRKNMRLVRVAMVGMLGLIALVMKAPLWYLPSKMSLILGGDGWHRSYLMHQFITHMDQWWLAGMPLDQTREWFPYLVGGAVDITNVFVAIGLDGGVIAIGLFVLLLVQTYKSIGRSLQTIRRGEPNCTDAELLVWGLGTAIAGHIVNFFAITYFDQTNAIWLLHLAMVAGVYAALATQVDHALPTADIRSDARKTRRSFSSPAVLKTEPFRASRNADAAR